MVREEGGGEKSLFIQNLPSAKAANFGGEKFSTNHCVGLMANPNRLPRFASTTVMGVVLITKVTSENVCHASCRHVLHA